MSSYVKKPAFLDTPEGEQFKIELISLSKNDAYRTDPGYSSNTVLYPDHVLPFIDKHLDYIRKHPTTDPHQYLSNLKLMTRIQR